MPRLLHQIVIDRPPGVVFDFATAPASWPRWHPATVGVDIAEMRSLEVGGRVTEQIAVGRRRGPIVWTATAHDRPGLWAIEAEDRRGRATITYRFRPEGAGTHFEREIVYGLRGPIASLLEPITLRPLMRRQSALALANLKRVIEAS